VLVEEREPGKEKKRRCSVKSNVNWSLEGARLRFPRGNESKVGAGRLRAAVTTIAPVIKNETKGEKSSGDIPVGGAEET